MKPTKKQLKQLDDFLVLADQVSNAADKVGILDSVTATNIAKIKDAANKARSVKNKVNIAEKEETLKKGPSIQDLIKMYQDLLKQKSAAGFEILTDGVDKFDQTIVSKASSFLSAAENFTSLVSAFKGVMPDKFKEQIAIVEEWIKMGKQVIDTCKKYEELLKKWAGIAKSYIDAGVDTLAKATGDAASTIGAAAGKIGGVVAEIKNFIDMAKALPDGQKAFADKLTLATGMLDKADTVLGKVMGIIGLLPGDETINNIHAWYDKIINTWKSLGAEGILSKTNIDDKLAAKLGALVGTAEKWLGQAMTIKNQVLDKIVAVQEMLKGLKKVMEWVKSAGDFLRDVKNGDMKAVFEKLKTAWTGLDNVQDIFAGTTWDDTLLAKVKDIKAKADNYAKLALTFVSKMTGQNETQVKEWAQKAMDLVVRMSQGEDVIGQYVELGKKWVQNRFEDISKGVEKATDAVIGQATSFANEIKQFIANASSIKGANLSDKIAAAGTWLKTSEGIFNKVEEIIGLVVGDKNENGLPDWYDQLDKFWKDKIAGKDFLTQTNLDDKLIGLVSGWKKSAEEWLEKATKASQNLIEKINNVRQWVDVASKALEFGAGIVKKIETKDWAGLYDEAMKLWNGIGNVDDILKGTKLDNKILDKLKEVKDKLSAWVVNGIADNLFKGDKGKANDVLSLADKAIRFLLTRHEVEDFSKEFKEDKIIITPPPLIEMTPEQEELMLSQLTIGMSYDLDPKDSNFVGKYRELLGKILDKIGDGLIKINNQIDQAYQKTLQSGYKTSQVYINAKKQYDSAIKIQNETVNLITAILKVGATVLISVVAPAAGVSAGVIQAIETGIKVFQAVDSGNADGAAELIGDKLGGGMITTALKFALPAMIGGKLNPATELDLKSAFEAGVTVKYQYIKNFVEDVQKKMGDLEKEVSKKDATKETLDIIKKQLLQIAKQWESTQKQILDKYVNTARDRINEALAWNNFSTGLYANWMVNRKPRTIRGEDPLIVKEVIKEMRKYTPIMAGVDWDEDSVGGKVSRFFGWLLGDWCTPGHKKAIQQMKANADKAYADISKPSAWKNTFVA